MLAVRLLLLLASLAIASSVGAATFNVDTIVDDAAKTACDDATPDDCSLRGAVIRANADPDHDTILVPSGTYTLSTASPCFFAAAAGDSVGGDPIIALCLNGDVDILGAGADQTVIQSNGQDRILAVSKDKTVNITSVTLSGGRATPGFGYAVGGGGAILNDGTVTVAASIVTDNQANAGGGGLYNIGTLTVISSTIAGNSTGQGGGGISNFCCGGAITATVIDSTISGNSAHIGAAIGNNGYVTVTGSTLNGNVADVGGGIYNGGGQVSVLNTTISGNTGNGIDDGRSSPEGASVLHLESTTIVGNVAGDGGGFYITGNQPVTVRNSIIAGNTSTFNYAPDCGGTITSEGYNLIQSPQNCTILGDTTSNVTGVEARLGPLADNGGSTRTHAPLPADDTHAASPAIDGGSPADPGSGAASACPAADQRGVLRPLGVRCDIGAFESSGTLAATSVKPSRAGNAGPLAAVVAGSGFKAGATVKLRRAGQADVAAAPVHVESGGASIAASFDLAGVALGAWDIVVTNPGGAAVTLAGALTVEVTRAPQLWSDVLARIAVRPGRPVRFSVLYGNRGNVDAIGVSLMLSLPKGFTFAPFFTIAPPPAIAGQVLTSFASVPTNITVDDESEFVNMPLFLPIVPAGFTGVIDFALTLPPGLAHGDDFGLVAKIGGAPWLPAGTPDEMRVADLVAGARAYAENAIAMPIPASVDASAAMYARMQLAAIASAGIDEVVARQGLPLTFYSESQMMIDVAAFMADQATATARPATFGASLVGKVITFLKPTAVDTADAATVCPPCVCGAVIAEGCSCGDCTKPLGPGDGGDNPLGGLKPGECSQLPHHKVSSSGTLCIPDGAKDCAIFQNAFYTDPDCARYPIKQSVDPNDKTASLGSGDTHVVTGDEPLKYAIAFENLETATAAAQVVTITDQLDTGSLDLATFGFGPIAIGAGVEIIPPPGLADFTGGADLRPGLNVIVSVDAHLDQQTGIVTWTFTSLDPKTGQLTDDADAGFLPPNTSPPAGEGRVLYTVSAKSSVATGTEIKNKASIVFDVNAPIETPEVSNVIDKTAPVSAVTSVDAGACGAPLTVNWSGTDTGSIVADYSVFVSTNGGPFTPWQENTSATSASFPASPGNTYAFYSTARDVVGNTEVPPAAADVTRAVAVCGTEHDLAVTKLKVPKVVKLTAKKPTRAGVIAVEIQNRSRHEENIPDVATLGGLVAVSVDALGACADPVATFRAPKKPKPITLKPAKKLKLTFDVTFVCAGDPAKGAGHADYTVQATVVHTALGAPDDHAADDVCPRDVTPPGTVDPFPAKPILDKGCGVKKSDKTFGGPVLIDVTGP